MHHRILLLLSLMLLGVPLAQAEQMVRFDGYELHYNVSPSRLLTTPTAARLGIVQAPNRALVNVTVLKLQADGRSQPVTSQVQGQARNLMGQSVPLQFRTVIESDQPSAIAELRFDDEELFHFELEVTPAGSDRGYPLRFDQQLFIE
ncbi:MAG TPA: DUF4426 domain-containing protein [Pseudomonadales bacterium]|jgi:hypothetical protein|nr:DUF4426 domain-containing protein [Pseudomonadales bacterium]HMZ70801.1 DUF4426 domain-containing protein [Pseudomonadales bacterium]HNB83921.1 DUF4426 domain-containing protein [Pseudomonadales bacterium]HNC76675.1 DUF4426 domain-containing protein [Pseudomonadales bacterium]HND27102.1 DUF4426 domain-containing protein [Pseudomonadales bacterium]